MHWKNKGNTGGRVPHCKECWTAKYQTIEKYERKNAARKEKRKDPKYRKHEMEIDRISNSKNISSYLLRSAKYRAKKKGIEFTIKSSELVIPTYCPLLGVELKYNEGRAQGNSFSIDRIDNSKGYIPGNVWVISHRANMIKSDATLEDLELLVVNLKKVWDH